MSRSREILIAEELEAERYTHSSETLAQVLVRVRRERFDTPAHKLRQQRYALERLRKMEANRG